MPHSIEFNKRTTTDPTAMSNVFNNYFTTVAERTKYQYFAKTFHRLRS